MEDTDSRVPSPADRADRAGDADVGGTGRWILRSQRVLGPDGVFAPAEVVMEGARIEAVDWGERHRDEGPEVLDVGRHAVTPAFVNAHTHLVLGFLRGFDAAEASAGNVVEDLFYRYEGALTAADVRAFARMGAYETLLHGVGFVWDHYYFGEALVDALLDVGLAGAVAPTLQDVTGPGVGQLEEQLAATEAIAGRSDLAERGIVAALGPHATDTVSDELWRRVASEAERLGIPVHSHVAQSAEECLRSLEEHGCMPLRRLERLGLLGRSPRTLLIHCLYATDDELDALGALDPGDAVALGFCPYAQRVFGFTADPRRWQRRALPWFVATDTSAGNDSMNLQKELRAVAELRTTPTAFSTALAGVHGGAADPGAGEELEGRRRALREVLEVREQDHARAADLAEPRSLLSRVWEVPGRLHPSLKVGAIGPGALANLLIWDTRHPAFWPAVEDRSVLQLLAMGDTTAAIHGMVVAGRLVSEAGDHARSLVSSEAYRDARDEASRRLAELMQRAG